MSCDYYQDDVTEWSPGEVLDLVRSRSTDTDYTFIELRWESGALYLRSWITDCLPKDAKECVD